MCTIRLKWIEWCHSCCLIRPHAWLRIIYGDHDRQAVMSFAIDEVSILRVVFDEIQYCIRLILFQLITFYLTSNKYLSHRTEIMAIFWTANGILRFV